MGELSLDELEQYVIERNCNFRRLDGSTHAASLAVAARQPVPNPQPAESSPGDVVDRLISAIAADPAYLPGSPDLTIASVHGYGLHDLREAGARRRANATYFGKVIGLHLEQPATDAPSTAAIERPVSAGTLAQFGKGLEIVEQQPDADTVVARSFASDAELCEFWGTVKPNKDNINLAAKWIGRVLEK